MNIVQSLIDSNRPHMNGVSKSIKSPLKSSSKDSDIILLSDEEEDEEFTSRRTENGFECQSRQDPTHIIRHLENELRNEESILSLLQHIRTNQRAPLQKPTTKPSVPSAFANNNINNNNPILTTKSSEETIDLSFENDSAPVINEKVLNVANVKVTRQMALTAIEQQFAAKRAVLRKQIEKSLEKISYPISNAGVSEIAFVPSVYSGDFLALIGLEEVCRGIRDFDSAMNKSEPRRVFNPFTCARCETDFTPVWKRDKPGSAGVACEACLAGSHRSTVQKEYETAIKNALELHSNSEMEIDNEYNEFISNEEKIQLFIKEHEKKLNDQMHNNPSQTSRWPASNSPVVNGTVNRYSNSSNSTPQTAVTNGNVTPAISNATTTNSLQQQQLNLAQAQLIAQLQQQKASPNNSQTNAILSAMAVSGANNASQQQQRLNSLIAQLQGQQAANPQETVQMAQLQQALMNSMLPQTQTNASSQQQQLINQLVLQSYLLRPQNQQPSMQQLAMAQQQQHLLLLQAAQQQQHQQQQQQQYLNSILSLYQQHQQQKK